MNLNILGTPSNKDYGDLDEVARQFNEQVERELRKERLEERLGKKAPETEETQNSAPGVETQAREGFIYVPSVNLSFSRERVHCEKNWYEAHKLLQAEKLRMPEMNEFREFLKYLRDNEDALYGEITENKGHLRSNWIDAYFEQRQDGLYMKSGHVYSREDKDGKIILKSGKVEKLEGQLMNDRWINIDEWLDNPTLQGFPRENIKEGELYYMFPLNGGVARFYADLVGADLICSWGRAGTGASLGVFGCFEGVVRAEEGK